MTDGHDGVAGASRTATTGELRRLVDHHEITRTMHRCGRALDHGDEADFVDCFVVDGRFTVEQDEGVAGGSTSRRVTGHQEIASWAQRHTRAPAHRHEHTLSSLDIDFVEDSRATARSYFVRMDARLGVPYVYAFGRYLDELVRCDDGRWRFRSRVVEIEARADTRPEQLTVTDQPGA